MMDPHVIECTTCTRRTGKYNQIFLNEQHDTYIDPYANFQCPDYFQCTNTILGEETYGKDTDTGCCVPCAPSQACYNGTVGEYSNYASLNACPSGHICDPVPRICPVGTICENNIQQNCTDIRERAINVFKFGDIHAGTYCPEGSSRIQPCPAGYYCPGPETKITCPAGFFCPVKTDEPYIKCDGCGEGALDMERSDWLIAVIAPCAVLFVAIMVNYARRNRITLELEDAKRLEILRNCSECEQALDLKNEAEFERVLPLLEGMAAKIDKMIKGNPEIYMHLPSRIIFRHPRDWLCVDIDAGKLFSFLDVDFTGELTYDELNEVLQLNDIKLKAFMTNMNHRIGTLQSETEISKTQFTQYFFETLVVIDNFGPSAKQAEELYDELCELSSGENGAFLESDFYNSRLQNFLDDIQINELIKGLRTSGPARKFSNGGPILSQLSTITIQKRIFVKAYPNILNRITHNNYVSDRQNEAEDFNKGIDIAFKNLSLEVSVAKKKIRILDHLTGRIKAGTMTALM